MSEHIYSNKLEGFSPVYVINLKSRTDRFNYIVNELKSNNVSDYEIIEAIDGASTDFNKIVHDRESLKISDSELGATLSHLKAIKHWLDTSVSDYAIIMEDDLSFETIKYWNFNFKDFVKSVEKKYNMLQLCIIHNFKINTDLHIRERRDWSAACYLITRNRAEVLIGNFYVDGKYKLPSGNVNAVADSLIYAKSRCYSQPLFTYTMDFETSIESIGNSKQDKENPKGIHHRSRNEIIEFWEKNEIS
jgi:GR25 family glycosyltransferase involved in LPS biosynthesis